MMGLPYGEEIVIVGRTVVTDGHRGVYSIEAWTQSASLKKRGGTKIMHIFVNIGEEILRGKKD